MIIRPNHRPLRSRVNRQLLTVKCQNIAVPPPCAQPVLANRTANRNIRIRRPNRIIQQIRRTILRVAIPNPPEVIPATLNPKNALRTIIVQIRAALIKRRRRRILVRQLKLVVRQPQFLKRQTLPPKLRLNLRVRQINHPPAKRNAIRPTRRVIPTRNITRLRNPRRKFRPPRQIPEPEQNLRRQPQPTQIIRRKRLNRRKKRLTPKPLQCPRIQMPRKIIVLRKQCRTPNQPPLRIQRKQCQNTRAIANPVRRRKPQ